MTPEEKADAVKHAKLIRLAKKAKAELTAAKEEQRANVAGWARSMRVNSHQALARRAQEDEAKHKALVLRAE